MSKTSRGSYLSQLPWLQIVFWLACVAFPVAVIRLCRQYPRVDTQIYPAIAPTLLVLVALLTAVAAGAYFGLRVMQSRGYLTQTNSDRLRVMLREHAPGLALAVLFLIAYASLAFTIGILPDDNFYDTDSASWFNRLAAPADQLIDMRPVHPFAFLIFRPLVSLLALLLAGDKYHAALLLNAAAGAACVFLAWLAMRTWSRNPTFALLTAAVLGVSTSHLILSAALETYIFSAAALILFVCLLQREDPPLRAIAPAGLLTFGITITNFIQTCIMSLLLDFNAVKFARYLLIVLVSAVILAFAQAQIYPTSQPFYVPSLLLAEDRYSFDIRSEGRPRVAERAHVLARTISVFSVVAPRPLVLLKETGCLFPCFQTYKHRWDGALINSYAGFGSFLARTWFLILMLAGVLYIWRLLKSPRSVMPQIALLACILFNFLLHMLYGDDPMLYSGDWTYAVVFFTALSYVSLAERKSFQAAMLTFLAMLMLNNWRFLAAVLSTLAAYSTG